MAQNYFLDTLQGLLLNEELILYSKVPGISEADKKVAGEFLIKQYENEKLNYPFSPPEFNLEAALWSAEFVYLMAQLILYRETKIEEIENMVPKQNFPINSSTILSVDLTMRFLPDILEQLKSINREDPLMKLIFPVLETWHFSGIQCLDEISELQFEPFLGDSSICQMYTDRVIFYRKKEFIKNPILKDRIRGSLGIHKESIWSEIE